ncbi:L-methionine/branched-chain amino acid transporter, partial [Escherichia coli]|nr:L-methionine/branched-chain amino acid transporter [Escherichia coli]
MLPSKIYAVAHNLGAIGHQPMSGLKQELGLAQGIGLLSTSLLGT